MTTPKQTPTAGNNVVREKLARLAGLARKWLPSSYPRSVRRRWFAGIVPLCAAIAPTGAAPAAEARPNIVVIVSDDHRADHLGLFGHPDLKTPHLDRLAKEGVAFRHAYVQAADNSNVCLPARTQLHSGRSLYSWAARQPAESDPPGFGLGRAFREAGYATLRTGKGVNVPSPLNAEFERNVEDSSLPLETHLTNALPFIREHGGRRPFLLVFEPRVPHSPYPTNDTFRALYAPGTLRLPPEFRERHAFLPLNPEPVRGERPDATRINDRARRAAGLPEAAARWTETEARATLARYYASISLLDDAVGTLRLALREAGVEQRTYVVFLGDNGFSIGHHGLFGKADVYENGGLHVPLLLAGPGITPRESRAFVYLTDVFPTVCELAGIGIPARVEGRSLVPALRGEALPGRDVAVTLYRDAQHAVRDLRWKLICFPGHQRIQLFDLGSDPRELNDLASDPAQAPRIAAMTQRLEAEKAALRYRWPLAETR